MKMLTISLAVFVLAGCSTLGLSEPNCFESVAVSKIALKEAYKSAAIATEENVINKDSAKEILTLLDSSDALAENASQLCVIDEKTARDYIKTISTSLNDVSVILTEKK